MKRLWVRLTAAFLVFALVAVGTVAILSARAAGEGFRQYLISVGNTGQPAWAEAVEAYYATQGSWDGVDALLAGLRPGAGVGHGPAPGAGPNLAIADTNGRVVASRTGDLVGQEISASVLAQGVPLTLNGQSIGTLLNVRSADVVLDAQGQAFLNQVRTSVIWAALLALLVALELGLLLSRSLTAPLRRLTKAAAAIAGGNLHQHVDVNSQDEIGDLAGAFNRMAASLTEAETLRKNLVADVAHELRTPLTVIQGNLQAILDGVYPLEMAQVAGVYDETRLLTRLVDDLHDLTLADAGQLRLDLAPVNLADLARATVARFGSAAEAVDVKLMLETDDAVPVVGDADRLAQVLTNLLGNALRHTPTGGRVTVSVRPSGDQVRLQVADTGSGIAPEDLPHVFDRFYRGDRSRSRRGGGTGLGLAIVRQLIVAHVGQVSVDSRLGEGATFTILLPVAK